MTSFELHQWAIDRSTAGGSRITGSYRLERGLACTLWLERRRGAWELATVIVHPERDIVPVGPISRERVEGPTIEEARRELQQREAWRSIGQRAGEDLTGPRSLEWTTRALADEADPDLDPPAVTARMLRELPLGAIVDDLRGRVYEPMKRVGPPVHGEGSLEGSLGNPGRRGRPDEFYAGVALAYVQALEQGSRSPARDIAEERSYSTSMVNNWIHQARRRGLLTSGPRGRAGGVLTERAHAALGEEREHG